VQESAQRDPNDFLEKEEELIEVSRIGFDRIDG
jgi:hypothetical protein